MLTHLFVQLLHELIEIMAPGDHRVVGDGPYLLLNTLHFCAHVASTVSRNTSLKICRVAASSRFVLNRTGIIFFPEVITLSFTSSGLADCSNEMISILGQFAASSFSIHPRWMASLSSRLNST